MSLTFHPHPYRSDCLEVRSDSVAIGQIVPDGHGSNAKWWRWSLDKLPQETIGSPLGGTSATIVGAKTSLIGQWKSWLRKTGLREISSTPDEPTDAPSP